MQAVRRTSNGADEACVIPVDWHTDILRLDAPLQPARQRRERNQPVQVRILVHIEQLWGPLCDAGIDLELDFLEAEPHAAEERWHALAVYLHTLA